MIDVKGHLIVVSIDAFVFDDIEYARSLPNFARILKDASVIERVKSIYPTLTHPVHASILSGQPAGVTGVVSNMIFNPENPLRVPAPWYNRLDEIKCDTLLHAAKRAGLTTAVCAWPCTCLGTDVIDYLVPGCLNVDFVGHEDDPLSVYRALGASECLMDVIEEGILKYGYGDVHPSIDEFQIFCSAEIIKRYKPDLLLTHPSYVDNRRHASGVFTDEVKLAIRETDRWLGMLLDAVREAGISDDCSIVLLSDHGHINISRVISPNVYLADKGYIRLDAEGNIISYDAFCKSGGASAYVYLASDDVGLYSDVYKLLSEMAEEGIYGFSRVFTADEVKAAYGLCGAFSFVLETDGYSSFGDHVTRPVVRPALNTDYRYGKGTHGYMPEKGAQPTFIASGPMFKSGVVIPEGSVLNHAPTLARALGATMKDTAGVAVCEILKEN